MAINDCQFLLGLLTLRGIVVQFGFDSLVWFALWPYFYWFSLTLIDKVVSTCQSKSLGLLLVIWICSKSCIGGLIKQIS